MKYSFRILFLPLVICLALPGSITASVVFKPKENAHYMAPGEEKMSGTAAQLFEKAQEAERRSDLKGAIKAYRVIVKKHPKDTLAAGACYRMGQLQEQIHQYLPAAQSYAVLAEKYQKSERFEEAVEGLFRIGEMYLTAQKTKILGIPIKSGTSQSVIIFSMIIRTAPYGKYTARAQFDLGRAYEKQGSNELAIAAYQAVVEKFPNDPLAIDAQYQIGYIWSRASASGTYDPAAAKNAKIGFEDFLARYPNSEKAKQAKENLKRMEHKQTSTAFDIAKFYDKQKYYRAARHLLQRSDSATAGLARGRAGQEEGQRAAREIRRRETSVARRDRGCCQPEEPQTRELG